MGKGAIWIGILLILVGVWGAYQTLVTQTPILVLIYPLLAIGIGIALIILYKEEDKIEQRRDLNRSKSKR